MRHALAALVLFLGAACAAPPRTPPPALTVSVGASRTATPLGAVPPPAETTGVGAAGVPGAATAAPASSGAVGVATAGAPTANAGAAVGTPVGGGPADAGADVPVAVQTAIAVKTYAGPKATPEQLDPRALAADPAPQVGKPVMLVGQVARVVERGSQRWAELLAQPPGETEIQSVDLLLDADVAPIARDECYRVVGVAAGRDELGRAFTGSSRDVPLVLGTEVAPAPLGPYGIGCAPP